jgi:hypothetical protein
MTLPIKPIAPNIKNHTPILEHLPPGKVEWKPIVNAIIRNPTIPNPILNKTPYNPNNPPSLLI